MVAVSDSCLVLPGPCQQHSCWVIGHAWNPFSQLHQLAYGMAEPGEIVYQRELN
jgi:hypothetical protein